jgi:energy-coupling factor transport system permease protein
MLNNLAFEQKNAFLQTLHTRAALCYVLVMFIIAMIFDHPLFLIGILLAVLLAIVEAGALDSCEGYLQMGIWMTLVIMVVNPLVIHSGTTILWSGPEIPVLGPMTISLEAACYGAVMGLRLIVLLLLFGFYNQVVDPDRLLSQVSHRAYKTGLMVSMATRLFPGVVRDLAGAREVQQLRGVDFRSGNLKERVRKNAYVLKVVLISTLEGSFQTAEAMEARAFGIGQRSSYQRELLRPRDLICLTSSLAALALGIYIKICGYGRFVFYPRLGDLLSSTALPLWLGLLLLALLLPIALSWGWKLWPFLKSKI